MRLVCSFALILLASAALLAQSNPVPLINQPLVPASAAPGGAGFNLTVNGTGFTSASVIEWNGVTLITTVVSSQKLAAKVPAARIAKAGTASITVVNPNAPSSNVVFFPVANAEPIASFAQTLITGFYSPASGDFNNDGKVDLASNDGNSLSIRLGKGDGTFGAPIASACLAGFTVVADFNGDGKLDVATTSVYTTETQVCLGNGDGTLTALQPLFTGYSFALATGDLNRDGKLDLVVTAGSLGDIGFFEVLLGNGDGTFTAGQGVPVGTGGGTPTVGDFNGDGWLDVAVPDQNIGGGLGVFLGNGDGTFQPQVDYLSGGSTNSAMTADLNGDGRQDLVVSNSNTSTISVLLGNGDGTFQSHIDYSTGPYPKQIVLGDLNSDGKLDLVIADNNFCSSSCDTGFVSVLLGNGDGTLQNHTDVPVGASPSALTIGDFNRDGRLDIAVDGGGISILLQSSASLSPSNLVYAGQNVGTSSSPQNLTLTNSGRTAITISGITFTGANPTDYSQTNTCGNSLPAGSNCTISVTFTPTATGTRTATINVNDSAVGSPQTAAMSGTGTAPAVTLSSNSLTFPTQLLRTTSAAQQVTLTNTGTGTLNITSIVASGEFTQTNTCGTSVGVGASCTITVQFSPTQKDTGTGMVTITDDAPGSPQTIALTGCGTVVKLSGIAVNFGNQRVGTTSPPVTVTITNISGQTLTISSISIGGSNGADFAQTNTCASGVPGHGSCKISLQFTPTKTGARSATLSISDNGGCSPQQVSLSGTGT